MMMRDDYIITGGMSGMMTGDFVEDVQYYNTKIVKNVVKK